MAQFLDRYLAGEYVAVWKELVALGPGVRQKRHHADAEAVAAETMRRARHNVELLIRRLDGMGLQFLTLEGYDENQRCPMKSPGGLAEPLKNRSVFSPPTKETPKTLDKLEEMIGGPLPLSLRAWYEQVGGVSLLGWHATLSPNPGDRAYDPEARIDPLVLLPLDLVLQIAADEQKRCGSLEEFRVWAGAPGQDCYGMKVPDKTADAIFDDARRKTLVQYLREAFAWGGLPPWRRTKAKPPTEIVKLTEGLLPL